jgi:NagD protein
MLAAVEACTGAKAEAVLGKPGPQMAAEVRSRLAVQASDAAMVGDRILTDVAMSRALGMTSILVLSGATAKEDVAASSVQPDYVIDNLAGLLPPERPEHPENPAPPASPREPQ